MTRKILSIKRTDSAEELEEHLNNPVLGNYTLRIPTTVKWGGSISQSASLAQFISTWAQRADDPSLNLFATKNEDKTQLELVTSLHGLSAVYFSNVVTGGKSDKNIRYEMLEKAFPRMDAMWNRDYQNVSKGRRIDLISIAGAQREFLPALYCRIPRPEDLLDRQRHGHLIRSEQQMTGLFQNCLKCLRIPYRSKPLLQTLFNDNLIGDLLYEAFRNTAEHAYLTERGQVPKRGLRSVSFKIHSVDRKSIRILSPFSTFIERTDTYFEHVLSLQREYSRNNIDFLEISILDSGPGFAATMRKSAPNKKEKELVSRCFEINTSRKPGENSGFGLNRILSAVKILNGLFRVRTSTCEVSFCCLDEPDEDSHLKPTVIGEAAMVAGTLITVCIPIAY